MHRQADERTGHQYLDYAPLEAEQGNRRCNGDKGLGPVQIAAEAPRPKHVIAEETRQIEDHTDNCCRNGGKRCSELEFIVGRFHQRAAREDEQERGQERKPGHQDGCNSSGHEHVIATK